MKIRGKVCGRKTFGDDGCLLPPLCDVWLDLQLELMSLFYHLWAIDWIVNVLSWKKHFLNIWNFGWHTGSNDMHSCKVFFVCLFCFYFMSWLSQSILIYSCPRCWISSKYIWWREIRPPLWCSTFTCSFLHMPPLQQYHKIEIRERSFNHPLRLGHHLPITYSVSHRCGWEAEKAP